MLSGLDSVDGSSSRRLWAGCLFSSRPDETLAEEEAEEKTSEGCLESHETATFKQEYLVSVIPKGTGQPAHSATASGMEMRWTKVERVGHEKRRLCSWA